MITNLRLRNFKTFSDRTIPLGGLTLLSGLNGSGKSTVLQALGLLRQSADIGTLHDGEALLNGSLVDLGTVRDILFQHFDRPEIEMFVSEIHGEELHSGHWSSSCDIDSDVVQFDRFPGIEDTPDWLHRPGFQYLRADRITPAVTYPRSKDAVRSRRFLGSRGEFAAHYLLDFGVQPVDERLIHPSETSARSLDAQINAWLQEFSPGVRVESFALPMTDLVRLAYSFKTDGAAYDNPLRPTNVGFGLTHSLPILMACLGARPGELLLIENPEAQLHPQGQVALGNLLARTAGTGVQIVVESHSDHVLNGLRLGVREGKIAPSDVMTHFFRRFPNGSDFETPEIGEDGRLSYWPEGFFDQWEKSIDRLLS